MKVKEIKENISEKNSFSTRLWILVLFSYQRKVLFEKFLVDSIIFVTDLKGFPSI